MPPLRTRPRRTSLRHAPRRTSLRHAPRRTSLRHAPRRTSLRPVPRRTSLRPVPRRTSLRHVLRRTSLRPVRHRISRRDRLHMSRPAAHRILQLTALDRMSLGVRGLHMPALAGSAPAPPRTHVRAAFIRQRRSRAEQRPQ
jgi:hypothetical protein